jgi:hypothetical protein
MVSKLKKPPTEWEKTFANYTSGKGLSTRIYREFKKLISSKINEPIKKWATALNRTFSKEEMQMVKIHMKKCSLCLYHQHFYHLSEAFLWHKKINSKPLCL